MNAPTTHLPFGLESLGDRVTAAWHQLQLEAAESKGNGDHWTGKLSDSALSTATAVSAMSMVLRDGTTTHHKDLPTLIEKGSQWLARAQNDDGGFGDTDRSLSNIATTLLVIAAWEIAGHRERHADAIQKAWAFVDKQGRWDGLRSRYGKDKTFVVPIMMNCALAGLLSWKEIPTLPFEAAALPQSWYRFAKMPVVSYAVPALVAIGQAQWHHNPPANPLVRSMRGAVRARTLRVLATMQPESGGYLEATPLTSFVLMSLASIGLVQHSVSQNAVRFLVDSAMPDGSWPIDTNLATWVTSLTMRSYYPTRAATGPNAQEAGKQAQWDATIDWLLSCQHTKRHPFTGAEPGGWGWTDLSGSVPDSDDTPAALLALAQYTRVLQRRPVLQHAAESERLARVLQAAEMGCKWLLRLQNSDGGWPTFCRGWGTLPFDRSGTDLTAHALRALNAWRPRLMGSLRAQSDRAADRGWRYLERTQHRDGSWLPLWFGNQDREEEDNPFYGTARVLLAYGECGDTSHPSAQRAISFLKQWQNADGSWGGGPSIRYPSSMAKPNEFTGTIEETAVVLEGIMASGGKRAAADSIMRGLVWLCDALERHDHHTSQPIGFYFAKLWYHEKHYPLAFSLAALRKGLEFCQR
ncbi:Sporulenol synthase [Pirellula sp. SH-Sr6A]|uniref:prenyltransferase/squalene oxidase repeat-containing protein n=1 Tax=Pirellula sp. SH-Sr6A TaxID=1632865 RepID=UPI00078B703E|nr:prenyltransferase/squalene oxidase repeat-containing protein [Pirellula sp. SH-Sr6A]AMV34191.1 Sporulenol synthase [Pirellula sp. SH-Sr6A]